MRMFIAAGLPEDDKARILRDTGEIRKSRFVRPVAPEGMHVTLCFLGERDEGEKEQIVGAMHESVRGIGPVQTAYQGIYGFPSPARPRVIVVPLIQGVEQLQRIYYALHDRLIGGTARRFSPHITVGRVKGNYQQTAELIAPEGFRKSPKGEYTISSITLYQSILHPRGAEYRKLFEARLQEQDV